jgi:hypothetical protein
LTYLFYLWQEGTIEQQLSSRKTDQPPASSWERREG